MKSRLVVAALLARGVVEPARSEFNALVHEGDDDMSSDEVVRAAIEHRAEALLFANTLALSADMIGRLPMSLSPRRRCAGLW
jgi:cobalamin biosynthesis protein CobD/CbiB